MLTWTVLRFIVFISFSITILVILRAWYWNKNISRLKPGIDSQELIDSWNKRSWRWIYAGLISGLISITLLSGLNKGWLLK